MSAFRINLFICGLIAVLLFLQYKLWFQADGMHSLFALKKTIALQQNENDQLKKQNDLLVFQIQRLQKSQDAAETRARNELGMIKKGETFYQVIKNDESKE